MRNGDPLNGLGAVYEAALQRVNPFQTEADRLRGGGSQLGMIGAGPDERGAASRGSAMPRYAPGSVLQIGGRSYRIERGLFGGMKLTSVPQRAGLAGLGDVDPIVRRNYDRYSKLMDNLDRFYAGPAGTCPLPSKGRSASPAELAAFLFCYDIKHAEVAGYNRAKEQLGDKASAKQVQAKKGTNFVTAQVQMHLQGETSILAIWRQDEANFLAWRASKKSGSAPPPAMQEKAAASATSPFAFDSSRFKAASPQTSAMTLLKQSPEMAADAVAQQATPEATPASSPFKLPLIIGGAVVAGGLALYLLKK